MKIYNDLLTVDYQNEIENILTDVNFPWYYYQSTTDQEEYDNITSTHQTTETPQFVHIFYMHENTNSHYINSLIPLITTLEEKIGRNIFDKMIRFKANLLTKNSSYPENHHHLPHTDNPFFETESLLYYVNETDGETFFFNEKPPCKNLTVKSKLHPKKGTMVFFDSSYYHASSPPRFHDARLVLNIVFKK